MSKVKLSNGITYSIANYATPDSFVIILGSLTASEVLDTFTEENLSEIQFLADNGGLTGVYRNQLLCGYTDNGNTLTVNIDDADLCRYGLVLDDDNRIVSAQAQRYAPDGAIIVHKLPVGIITDYRYIDGEYIYDPLPKPDPEPSTPTLEDRVDSLEATTEDMILLMAELIGG